MNSSVGRAPALREVVGSSPNITESSLNIMVKTIIDSRVGIPLGIKRDLFERGRVVSATLPRHFYFMTPWPSW